MNASAKAVMKVFPDVCVAYGESDEMSFVFHKDAEVYGLSDWTELFLKRFCQQEVDGASRYCPS